jgi:hypothetical protein
MAERDMKGLFLPELVEPKAGPWTKHEVDIQDAAVDTEHREAWVPKAHTPSQRLARLHELGHVKYSPRDWMKRILRAKRAAEGRLGAGQKVDLNAVEKIQKMLEENRIDWLLWDQHGIDLRPARETLDWGKMPDPPSVLYALGMCLQLAWTVWASRGLGSKSVSNQPPARTPDVDTGEYFDRCWAFLCTENDPLARAMIRGCTRMYTHPTHEMRDQVAGELALFFPLVEEEDEKPPPPKKEEQEAQDEAEREEEEHAQQLEDMETGIGSEAVTKGRIQYHDHTASVRRPSMRIARRHVPVSRGIGIRFAHRWYLDKAIFSQRLLTEAGIMIDGSGSMKWNDEDMQDLGAKLPAVRVGVYSGLNYGFQDARGEPLVGRICIIAKNGRFAKFTGLDPEMNGGNDVDLEALQLLARWPKPRLWLSDGFVCGGLHSGPPKDHPVMGCYNSGDGRIHELCNAVMRQHEIYRVPSREVMHRLLRRERVTLYRSTTASQQEFLEHGFRTDVSDAYPVPVMPVTFQL